MNSSYNDVVCKFSFSGVYIIFRKTNEEKRAQYKKENNDGLFLLTTTKIAYKEKFHLLHRMVIKRTKNIVSV
jgi:hypothetical protein